MATDASQQNRNAIRPEKLTDPDWAWAPYEPGASHPWTLQLAGHLYRRAAFGANGEQLKQALADGPRRTIDRLLRPTGDMATFNRTFDEYEVAAAESGAEGVRAWWLRRMIETPYPLLEQMTLFWHNHFAISNARVNHPLLYCRYVQRLRRHALGSFEALLGEITSNPAVFAGLEARANRKAKPNLHFPRTLLEQYTVGPGQFTERDVQTAARAFTGWSVLQNELRYSPLEHDAGAKRFLGQEGPFEGNDIVRILLQQPATAQLVVQKLYRWLISETNPSPALLIAPLAASFARNHDVAQLVETMLRSNCFFSPTAYRQKIKSPVEFAVGIIRSLNGTVGTMRLGTELAALGQDLFHPPTFKGWAGHRYWINRFTVMGRTQLGQALLASSGSYEGKLDPLAAARELGHLTPEKGQRFLLELLLQGDLPENGQAALAESVPASSAESPGNIGERLRQLAGKITALPEYQLA